MAEPATSSGAAWAVAAGLSSAFLAAVGVSWPALLFATLGALIGSGWAPRTGRLRSVVTFPAVCLLAAKSGVLGAAYVGAVGAMSGDYLAQAVAGATGLFFHPLSALAVRRLNAAQPTTAPEVTQ